MAYLVIGGTGEYSDHVYWFVGWSTSKEEAEELCHQVSLEAQATQKELRANPSAFLRSTHYTTPLPSDPHCQMHWNGASYWVEEVEEINSGSGWRGDREEKR